MIPQQAVGDPSEGSKSRKIGTIPSYCFNSERFWPVQKLNRPCFIGAGWGFFRGLRYLLLPESMIGLGLDKSSQLCIILYPLSIRERYISPPRNYNMKDVFYLALSWLFGRVAHLSGEFPSTLRVQD